MLEDLLHLLNRPQHEVDGRLWLGHSVRVLAAAKGQSGVLAVLAHDQLTLRPASAEGLPRKPSPCCLRSARAGRPGDPAQRRPGRRRRGREHRGRPAAGAPGPRHPPRRTPRTLADMFRDAGNRGQFGAASRDKWGKRVRQDRVVSFFSTTPRAATSNSAAPPRANNRGAPSPPSTAAA